MTGVVDNQAEVAQTEKLGLGDFAIASVLGAIVVVGLELWSFPYLLPSLWNDAVVAAGVRPAVSVMPNYWVSIARLVYSVFGVENAEQWFRILGRISLFGLTVCVYAVLREMLAFVMRARPQYSRRRTAVMQFASMIGAAAFVVADPVWNAGQYFSEVTILLILTIGAIEAFFVFLRKGTLKYAYICSVLLGLLAAESPLGFILPVIFISFNVLVIGRIPALESPFFKPALLEVGKWHMTFLYVASLIAGIILNCWVYVSGHGLGAIGETIGSIPLAYVLAYWDRIVGAADGSAWVLWSGVGLLPFVVTAIKFPKAADEEQFLHYATGLVFLVCGIVAFSQCASLPALWFWTYFPVGSQYLLSVGLLCCAATVASAVTILGVDAVCRNHRRLAKTLFGNDDEYEEGDVRMTMVSRSTVIVRRAGIVIVPLFLLVLMIPGRINSTTREMLTIIADAIAETVKEAGDAEYIFTDGNLDAAVELASARVGGSLKCLSLMGGSDPMSGFLRLRGMADEEDRFSFGYDTGMGLRTWIRDKPNRLAKSAIQMGFDLWKRDGKPLPPMNGMLSRPTGADTDTENKDGIGRAHELAKRVLAVHSRRGGIKACTDIVIRKMFLAVQWRLARMCIYRGEKYDLSGNAESAILEAQLGKMLNDKNATYQDLVKSMEKRNEIIMQKLTPREGLQLALVRADFVLGKAYAETILGADVENPDANFAMGMYYLKERQLSRAEMYLKRCLIRRPNEPAIYNNLAMIQIELKKFVAAEMNIAKALKLLPDSAAVLDTRKKLEQARNVVGKTGNP